MMFDDAQNMLETIMLITSLKMVKNVELVMFGTRKWSNKQSA